MKDDLPKHLWMNDDDLIILPFLKKHASSLYRPTHTNSSDRNYGINGSIYVPNDSQLFGSATREASAVVKMHPISLSENQT